MNFHRPCFNLSPYGQCHQFSFSSPFLRTAQMSTPQRRPAKERSLFTPESNEENTTDAENSDHHNSSPSPPKTVQLSTPQPHRNLRPAKKRSLFTPESDKENTSPSHKRSRHDLDWNTTDAENSSSDHDDDSPSPPKKARPSKKARPKAKPTSTNIKKPRARPFLRKPKPLPLAMSQRTNDHTANDHTANDHTAKKGILVARAGTYFFNGSKCIHTSPATWKDFDWKTLGAHEHTLDDSCLALQNLNMAIYKPLNLVLCREHYYLLDASSFRSHVYECHSTQVTKVNPADYSLVKDLAETFPCVQKKSLYLIRHIQNAFQLPEYANISSSIPFSSSLSFLRDPVLFWRCPNCEYTFHATENRVASNRFCNHFKDNPNCQKKAAAKLGKSINKKRIAPKDMPTFDDIRRYGHDVYPGTIGRRTFILLYPDGFTPTAGRVRAVRTVAPMPESTAVHQQSYAKDLQWDIAFVRFSKQREREEGWEDASRTRVLDLHQLLCSAPVQGFSDQETLEGGLAEVWSFLLDYILSANAWLKTCSRILRNRLTEGCVLTSFLPIFTC